MQASGLKRDLGQASSCSATTHNELYSVSTQERAPAWSLLVVASGARRASTHDTPGVGLLYCTPVQYRSIVLSARMSERNCALCVRCVRLLSSRLEMFVVCCSSVELEAVRHAAAPADCRGPCARAVPRSVPTRSKATLLGAANLLRLVRSVTRFFCTGPVYRVACTTLVVQRCTFYSCQYSSQVEVLLVGRAFSHAFSVQPSPFSVFACGSS